MKVMTIFGTRPEIIRLSLIIKRLDQFCDHVLVHTGQNYDKNLSDIFFQELDVRKPDFHLGIKAKGFSDQAGKIISLSGDLMEKNKPDRVLILGDTNSGLASIVAARMGIPVYHLEAGNRSFDNRVPEEINRRIIDHSSNILMPYTHRSKENLIREGIKRQNIFVIGNPIYEVLNKNREEISKSGILKKLKLKKRAYFLVTLHRAENVDSPKRLKNFLDGLSLVADTYQVPLVVSVHPRTADKMENYNLKPNSDQVKLLEPLGFFDFVALEKNASCVLSDSGTVQEECSIFNVPNVTLRDVTERAETIEVGSNILSGSDPQMILAAVDLVINNPTDWEPPREYLVPHVSTAVAKIVLGYHHDY